LKFIDQLSRFIDQILKFITQLFIFIDIHRPKSKKDSYTKLCVNPFKFTVTEK